MVMVIEKSNDQTLYIFRSLQGELQRLNLSQYDFLKYRQNIVRESQEKDLRDMFRNELELLSEQNELENKIKQVQSDENKISLVLTRSRSKVISEMQRDNTKQMNHLILSNPLIVQNSIKLQDTINWIKQRLEPECLSDILANNSYKAKLETTLQKKAKILEREQQLMNEVRSLEAQFKVLDKDEMSINHIRKEAQDVQHQIATYKDRKNHIQDRHHDIDVRLRSKQRYFMSTIENVKENIQKTQKHYEMEQETHSTAILSLKKQIENMQTKKSDIKRKCCNELLQLESIVNNRTKDRDVALKELLSFRMKYEQFTKELEMKQNEKEKQIQLEKRQEEISKTALFLQQKIASLYRLKKRNSLTTSKKTKNSKKKKK